jgi:hypothetical protein
VIDQKAVETEEKGSKIKSHHGRYSDIKKDLKNAEYKNEIRNKDPTTTSFNQMNFWRNRFESDRIKTFMNSRKFRNSQDCKCSIYKWQNGNFFKTIAKEKKAFPGRKRRRNSIS